MLGFQAQLQQLGLGILLPKRWGISLARSLDKTISGVL